MSKQLTFLDMEPAMEAIQLAEETIKDYRWMLHEIERVEKMLQDAGEGTVASWEPNAGIRAQYKNSDKTGGEVARRERQWKRVERLKKRVADIHHFMDNLTDEQESAVLEMLLDGVYVKDIAIEMGFSRQRAHEIKASLIRKFAWSMLDGKNPPPVAPAVSVA